MLIDTKLTKKSEMTINTLEELNRTNLIPTMVKNFLYNKGEENDPVFQSLVKKSGIVLQYEQCIDLLARGNNIACVF